VAGEKNMNEPIDTFNHSFVGIVGLTQNVRIEMLRPMLSMTPEQALTLAAILVCLAEPFAKHTFESMLRAVQNT
jgi:hypothetical protein